jgi:glucosamine-phosphate N-acetyltransferase
MDIEYLVKELTPDDLAEDKSGFLKTLQNLSETGAISSYYARRILSEIKSQNGHIYIAKTNDKKIIGTATLLVEQKFIHNGGKVGHIEDVAVRKEYEGNGVGSDIIKKLIELAKQEECYKIILDCNENNISFYQGLGFFKYENEMRLNLK